MALIRRPGSRSSYFGGLGLLTTAGKLPRSIGGLGMSIPEIGTLLFTTQLIVAFTLIFLAGPFTKRASIRQVAIISSIGFVLLAAYLPIAAHLGSHWAFKSSWLVGQAVAELWIPKQGVTLLALYPASRDRAFAMGANKQCAIAAGAVGTAGYGTLFGLSGEASPHTFGREAVWFVALGVAIVGVLVACGQPVKVGQVTRDHERYPEPEVADERTALLSRPEGDGSEH